MNKMQFTIYGNIPSMKNLIQFNCHTGAVYHKNNEVNKYKDWFAFQVPLKYKIGIDKPIRVAMNIFKKDNRQDSVNMQCIIFDCLQYSKIIKNDRQIIEWAGYSFMDKQEPRVEIFIEKMKEE